MRRRPNVVSGKASCNVKPMMWQSLVRNGIARKGSRDIVEGLLQYLERNLYGKLRLEALEEATSEERTRFRICNVNVFDMKDKTTEDHALSNRSQLSGFRGLLWVTPTFGLIRLPNA
ncbi:hypothetical protein LguiA_026812 [Lonicera macranthoides]